MVAGIGEILWDVFPEGKRLGGAPANFSYIAHALGARAFPVSAVGRDSEGAEILTRLQQLGLTARFIQEDPDHATGRVEVTVSDKGVPSYEIKESVAWDHIGYTGELDHLAAGLDALCFGSLAQRSKVSRKTIRHFIERAETASIRLLDINLRLDYYDAGIIDQSLRMCNWLKLNEEELETVSDLLGIPGAAETRIMGLRDRYDLDLIAVTLGADGSRLITGDIDHRVNAEPVEIKDTVGAGDAFSAALVTSALAGLEIGKCHEHAARMATYLCRNSGATPAIPADFRLF